MVVWDLWASKPEFFQIWRQYFIERILQKGGDEDFEGSAVIRVRAFWLSSLDINLFLHKRRNEI